MIKLVILTCYISAALSDVSHVLEKRQTTQPTYAQAQPYYNPSQPIRVPGRIQTPLRPTQPSYIDPQPYYPVQPSQPLYRILRLENEHSPDGSYRYAYETENGISAQETGQLKGTGEDAVIIAQGSYSYTSPEGIPVQVEYVADENGFHPIVKIILSNSPRRPT